MNTSAFGFKGGGGRNGTGRRKAVPAGMAVALALSLAACGDGAADQTDDGGNGANGADADINIGLLATLEGPFTALGEDSLRGAKLALLEYGGELEGTAPQDPVTGVTVGDQSVGVSYESSDGTPDVALEAARSLVELDDAEIVVGPSSGDEGLAVKSYAKSTPDATFVNGSSAAAELTLIDPAENFFRFDGDGAQWMAGLGSYTAEELGYETVATIAEDYSYPYAQVGGFQLELCRSGGEVAEKVWVPIGTSDYASVIQRIPDDVDAVFVALAGTDVVNFVEQYDSFTGGEVPLIAASSTIDQTTLQELGERMEGVPAAAPAASDLDTEAWNTYADAYHENFPDALVAPSFFSYLYYTNMKATLMGLEEVGGELAEGHEDYRAALSGLVVESPTGTVTLDENRNGIVPNFVFEVGLEDGTLSNNTVEQVEDVEQTLGLPEDEYLELAPYERDFTCEAE